MNRILWLTLLAILALLGNGLAVAHGGDRAAPVTTVAHCADPAVHSPDAVPAPEAGTPRSVPHSPSGCCQGITCPCSCAAQGLGVLPALASLPPVVSVSVPADSDGYRSVARARLLRPPIA